MSKGFGSGSSKKKKNVKQFLLDNLFAEGKKNYFAKNYSEALFVNCYCKVKFIFPKMGL